jgi:hypothetical protein
VSPEQCPECGRFLKNALVARSRAAPTPCPGCGEKLTAEMFPLDDGSTEAAAGPAPADGDGREVPTAVPPDGVPSDGVPGAARSDDVPSVRPPGDVPAAERPDDVPSVRPPDLVPETVRDTPDVLAGWDLGADAAEHARWRRDQRPFPTDTVVVLGAAVLGAAAGGVAWERRRAAGVCLGGVGGLLAAAVVRRIWRLED